MVNIMVFSKLEAAVLKSSTQLAMAATLSRSPLLRDYSKLN